MERAEAKNLIGCCGLYCGLCNKYQSKAPSRCIGCKLGDQHSWCSLWTCCVKKHRFETCIECSSVFSCAVFMRRGVADWIPAVHNLRQIGEFGLERVLREQEERQGLLEELLQDYNEGRSMSLYCKACARMPIGLIKKAIEEARGRIAAEKLDRYDMKSKARVLRSVIMDLASGVNVDLH